MVNKLAENIKALRKEHFLTQEQLAEVLGVTTGAVYKWEARLSQPDLNMVMAIAEFFNTSVDVLLGYEMKANNLSQMVERIKFCKHEKLREGLEDAETALKKYPNSFEIVYNSAELYMSFGLAAGEMDLLERALELYERSRILISQNTDSKVNENIICGNMAEILFQQGKEEEGIELLKKHNAGGIYNDKIGLSMSQCTPMKEEAVVFLSNALLEHETALVRVVTGYINVFYNKGAYEELKNILFWKIEALSGLREGEKPFFFDKIICIYLACLAAAEMKLGQREEAKGHLITAKRMADRFDAEPCYDLRSVRFVTLEEKTSVYDDIGVTARMGIVGIISSMKNKELMELWKGIEENEEEKKP